jgi:hypothetical protein
MNKHGSVVVVSNDDSKKEAPLDNSKDPPMDVLVNDDGDMAISVLKPPASTSKMRKQKSWEAPKSESLQNFPDTNRLRAGMEVMIVITTLVCQESMLATRKSIETRQRMTFSSKTSRTKMKGCHLYS